jgi:NAD(P)-dependent dehydrogenase (short-subunit alcohol dehydrogenase family)
MNSTKTFVITGITRGLGLALARRLLKDGHVVHGCGRRTDPLEAEERAPYGNRYSFQQLDIMDRPALAGWVKGLEKNKTEIDFLIHNAAVIHDNAMLWEIDPGQLQTVIDVNIMGSFNVLQAFLPGMLKRRHGIIITLSSGGGRTGLPGISGYCATKWAVEGLAKSLGAELPDGMAAIPMSPGIIDTDMLRSTFGDNAGNYPDPESWARVAAPFILGLDASRSGESITVPEPD